MKILCFSLVLMALFADTCCRSLTPKNDVPDPPKRFSVRLPPTAVLHPAQAKLLAKEKVPVPAEKKSKLSVATHVKLHVKDKFLVPGQKKSKVQASPQVKSNVLAKMKSARPIKSLDRANPNPVSRGHTPSIMKFPSNAQISSKGDGIKPANSKDGLFFHKPGGNKPTEGNITTAAPQMTTTTVDPWDEYCKEACEAGMAGPECDCAGHPIGRRHAPLLEPGSIVAEVERQPIQQYHPYLLRNSLPNHYRGNE